MGEECKGGRQVNVFRNEAPTPSITSPKKQREERAALFVVRVHTFVRA